VNKVILSWPIRESKPISPGVSDMKQENIMDQSTPYGEILAIPRTSCPLEIGLPRSGMKT